MLRILSSVVILSSLLLSSPILMSDLEKYNDYKKLINEKKFESKNMKLPKQETIENKIQHDYSLEKKTRVKKINQNIFQYETKEIDLIRYGASFFQNKNQLDQVTVPTSNNYILNSGDTIFINTYGTQKSKTYELLIDNNGNINIPDIGLVKIATLSFAEAKSVISSIITKAFPNTKVIVDISSFSAIQVVITGNVEVPGIYNLSSFSTVKDALLAAGGLLDTGSYRNIDVIRDGKKVYSFDLYKLLNDNSNFSDMILRASDIVNVNFLNKQVKLFGKVKNPAIYELKNNDTFKDLLKFSGGLSYDATKNSIKLTRYDSEKKLSTQILSKNKLFTMKPQDGDKIEVFNNYELKEKPYIYVHGKVIKNDNAKYKFFTGMTLKNLYEMVTFRSELLTNKKDSKRKNIETNKNKDEEDIAYQEYLDSLKEKNKKQREALFVDKNNIKIVRHNDEEQTVFLVSLEDNFELKPFDEVEFFNYFDTNPRVSVTIKGQVFKPGEIFIDKDTSFKELINLSGGFTKKAYKKDFELVRYKIENNERIREIKRISFDESNKHSFKLKDSDEINIFTIPNWYDLKKVELKGEVKFPGIYTIKTGEKLSSVIQRAGGFTDEAFIEGAIFTRESIKLNEAKRIKEAMMKLKQQISFLSTNGKEAGAKDTSTAELVATINLLDEQAKEYVPLGRLVVYLDKNLEKFQHSQFDIRLDDKDTLVVPSINDTVSVYGEVMNPSSFVYMEKSNIEDYIFKAGGLNDRADEQSIYMVLANGEARKINTGYLFSSFGQDITKGSTIVVPMKVNSVSNVLLWKEVGQIVYQLAVTAASLKTVGSL